MVDVTGGVNDDFRLVGVRVQPRAVVDGVHSQGVGGDIVDGWNLVARLGHQDPQLFLWRSVAQCGATRDGCTRILNQQRPWGAVGRIPDAGGLTRTSG
jgi:hypothetical protein